MKLSYNDIFKYSDICNPISQSTLLSAGNLAELGPGKIILDLGSGKGFPSLLWANMFGARVEGYDRDENFVKYANTRAEELLLSNRVNYYCKDIRELSLDRTYDVIAYMGVGAQEVYGNIRDALKSFQNNLAKEGFLFFSEPAWLKKPVPSKIQEVLGVNENMFLTKFELSELMEDLGFQVVRYFVSSKEDWDLYIRPVNTAMQEIIENKSDLAEEAKGIIRSFKSEYDAVGRYWNMILWVVKTYAIG